jgi:hypothetical protein
LKVICAQVEQLAKSAVSVIAPFIVTLDGLVVPVKLPLLPVPVQPVKAYPLFAVAVIVGVASAFSQVVVPETDPVGDVVPSPEGEITIVSAYWFAYGKARVTDEDMVPVSVLVVYHCSELPDPVSGFGVTDQEDPESYQ